MTIEQHYIDLMNADLDGEISAQDKQALTAFLAEDAEAQAAYADLQALFSELAATPSLDSPPHLKYAIMDSFKAAPKAAAQPPLWQELLAMPVFKHAAAFAAGAIMTFALISSNQIQNTAFNDVTGLVGTISETEMNGSVQDSIELTGTDLTGIVSLRTSGALAYVDFNLTSTNPIEVVAEFTDPDLWFRGFAQLENGNALISTGEGEVSMRMQGKNRYAVYLNHTGASEADISLKFYSAGNLIQEGSLRMQASADD